MSGDPFWHAIQAGQLDLPEPVLAFHRGLGTKHYAGECEITRSRNWMLRLLLRMGKFPAEGQGVPVHLTLITRPANAEWVRNFGGQMTRSQMHWDAQRQVVTERFGPFSVDMRLTAENRVLLVRIAGLRVLGIPVPGWLRPHSATSEFVDDADRFCFDVAAHLPIFGLLVRYRGWVVPEQG